jgi:hypothetical protein
MVRFLGRKNEQSQGQRAAKSALLRAHPGLKIRVPQSTSSAFNPLAFEGPKSLAPFFLFKNHLHPKVKILG